jgi:hypothetical protein
VVLDLCFWISGSGFLVLDFWFWISGSGFLVLEVLVTEGLVMEVLVFLRDWCWGF